MKNQLFLTMLFFMISIAGFGQTKKIDSLKEVLANEKLNDTTRFNNVISLTAEYLHINLDSFSLYTNKAMELSLKNNNYKLGRVYSNKASMKVSLASEMDSARYYLDKALVELDKKDDKKLRATVYSNFATTYTASNDYEKMLSYNMKAMELLKDDPFSLSVSHFNQATIYSYTNFGDLAEKHFKLALISAKKGGHQMVEVLAEQALAHREIGEGKYEIAKERLEKGLVLCAALKSPKICSGINLELGLLFNKMGELEKSKEALLTSRKYALEFKDDYEIMSVVMRLGSHELQVGNYSAAIQHFEDFNKIYEKRPEPVLGATTFYDWAKAETNLGNHKKANTLLEKHMIIQDSIFSLENRDALAETNAKYVTIKKDKEIAEQKLSIQESKSKTQIMSILIVSLLLASILLWFSFRQRQKRMEQQLVTIEREQEVKTLESLMEGEEKERFRIAKELHDGVNGDLAAIKFKLTSLLETNNQVINEAVAMIDTSSEQVRAISHNLVPPSLRDFNLIEAVDTYCENMNGIHTPEISFQHLGEDIVLEKKQEANLFRIVQELVTNSTKHAEAKEIHVQLSNVENNLQLTVEDDGKGFDVTNVKSDGIGMQNIKSRVAYLGGLMDITSDEKGTSFTITMDTKIT